MWKSTEDQLNFIRGLELNPDVIVNLKVHTNQCAVRQNEQYIGIWISIVSELWRKRIVCVCVCVCVCVHACVCACVCVYCVCVCTCLIILFSVDEFQPTSKHMSRGMF